MPKKTKELSNKNNLTNARMTGKFFQTHLAETMHLHYRDLKIDFGIEEFLDFANKIDKTKKMLENYIKDNGPKYSDKQIDFLKKEIISDKSLFLNNIFSIYELSDDNYYIRFRNIRIHVSKKDFLNIIGEVKNCKDL